MKSKFAEATRIVHAPAAGVYEIIADYRTQHPRILPKPYFLSLDVEEGGFGAGTIVNFKMRLLGKTQSFRSLITEPEPGKTLLETDLSSGVVTRFDVLPLENGEQTQVTITTELRNRGGVESLVAKLLLQKIYHQELELLAKLAEGPAKLIQSVTSDRTRGS
ncbi:MAG TPA: SRPBCC family protein [Anaerolineales bacterium]|nr:SRPBCC family protein [Anaerolineales bacterium]